MDSLVAPKSHQISTADGTALHVTDYLLPMAEVRGSIVVMHGFGEHSGRYRHVAKMLNECGLSVRCYDQRGHGRSEGIRGDVINGDPMLQDAEIIIDEFSAHFADPPLLLGHSIGGLFAARFALSGVSPLRGLILSSPAFAIRLSRVQNMLIGQMHKVAPSFAVPSRLKPAWLSHDANVVRAYKADPLVHGRISARLMRSILSSIDYCSAHAGKLTVPTLLLLAGDDRLVDISGSRHFLAQLPAGLAQMHVYDGFFHEVFNELDAARPFADLRAWLAAQGITPGVKIQA